MKVAARNDVLRISEHQRVVGCAVQLHGSDALHVFEAFSNRTMDLRYAAETIRILDASTVQVRLPDLALAEKSRETRRNLDLSAVRARPMDAFIEGLWRAF